ncbi:beta-ketoacyl synthase N-terminal-like domain-containing protein, partial [Streptomyces violaceoruber]
MKDVYLVDAVRTPFGKYNGGLSGVRPDDLAAHAIRELLGRTPGLDPSRIDDVYFGNANGAGEENRNVARMAALLAGLPTTVPGVTVNRLCASGLEAVIQAARAIAVGDASVALAGGVESMTRAPYVLPKPDRPFPAGHTEMYSTTLGWRMVNPAMDPQWTIPLGESAELIADKHGITREQQDEYALASHRKTARAQAETTSLIGRAVQEEAERSGGDEEAALKALVKRAIPDVMHLFNETRATARYDYTAYPALPDILKKPSKKDPDQIWEARP